MTLREHHILRIATFSAAAALALTLYVAWALTPIQGDVLVIRETQGVALFQRFEAWVNPLGSMDIQLGSSSR